MKYFEGGGVNFMTRNVFWEDTFPFLKVCHLSLIQRWVSYMETEDAL